MLNTYVTLLTESNNLVEYKLVGSVYLRFLSLLFLVAVMHFSFVSSLGEIPFDTADNALTIFNCTAGSRYAD